MGYHVGHVTFRTRALARAYRDKQRASGKHPLDGATLNPECRRREALADNLRAWEDSIRDENESDNPADY